MIRRLLAKGAVLVFRFEPPRGNSRAVGNPAIQHWVEQNGFVGMLIAALLPPPTPFKFFVFAAGVFEVPLHSYTTAITIARLFRYFGIGYLAIRYGADALPYLKVYSRSYTKMLWGLL